jgi:hypothetical protein
VGFLKEIPRGDDLHELGRSGQATRGTLPKPKRGG